MYGGIEQICFFRFYLVGGSGLKSGAIKNVRNNDSHMFQCVKLVGQICADECLKSIVRVRVFMFL